MITTFKYMLMWFIPMNSAKATKYQEDAQAWNAAHPTYHSIAVMIWILSLMAGSLVACDKYFNMNMNWAGLAEVPMAVVEAFGKGLGVL